MASETEDNYVCTLDEKSRQRAKDELGEDEKQRDGAIQTLREWIKQQGWMKSPTDSAFLLRFLRIRKFSQLGARETIERYWTVKTKNPQWFLGASPADPKIQAIIDLGFFLVIPGTDSDGKRIFIERPGVLNIKDIKKKYGLDVIFKTVCCCLDYLALDERVQVNGLALLMDTSDTGSDLSQVYNPTNLKKIAPVFTKAMPCRMKSINVYNASVLFETLMGLAKATLVPKKIGDRMHMHGKSMLPVYKEIGQQNLPAEYQPDDYDGPSAGTIAEIIEYTKKELQRPDVVAEISKLNSGKYNVDIKQRKEETDVPTESFRKLNVD